MGFRIVSLSATPVSKIENLQTIVESLRVSKFEVRDEDDEEVKRYTHDKNIETVIVDKENCGTVMEGHLFKLMDHALSFLRSSHLIAPNTHPKFINKMTILNL